MTSAAEFVAQARGSFEQEGIAVKVIAQAANRIIATRAYPKDMLVTKEA